MSTHTSSFQSSARSWHAHLPQPASPGSGLASHLRARALAFHGGVQLAGWRSAAALLALLATVPAIAGPEGEQVVRGNVSVQRNGNETLIRASDRSIINYRSFDISAGESVRFLQPSSDARVLNRIQGAAPTRIDGSLSANGRVYIVNPAGVVFGRGSVVNVSGLFAAAGNMSDRDFVSGVDRVSGMTGSVTNWGDIRGQQVVLAGSSVANMGNIVAPHGTVAMAAGTDMVISQRDGAMHVRVSGPANGDAQQAAVTNAGTINTSTAGSGNSGGGRVIMAAGDVFGLAINTTGTVKARSVAIEGQGTGDVIVSGTIDARGASLPAASNALSGGLRIVSGRSGAATGVIAQALTPKERREQQTKGGTIDVVGQRIAMYNATLDVSGESGGGWVRIGGDERGSRIASDLQTAQIASANSGTTIRADATGQGDGGRVILWSDDTTRSFASISATGGTRGGDGGFIETSGKNHLSVDGSRIDASAVRGEGGQWLLDPRNVAINNVGPTTGDFNALTPDVFTPNQDDSVVLASDITSRLDAGTSVTITTGSSGSQDGNISVDSDVLTTGSGATLRLEAANTISLNNGVLVGASGGGLVNVELIANRADANDPNPDAGAIVMNVGSSIITGGGNVFLGGGQGNIALGNLDSTQYRSTLLASAARGTASNVSGITLEGATIDAGAGTVTLRGVGAQQQSDAAGIIISSASLVRGASVRLDGEGGTVTGGAGGDNNRGVEITGLSTQVRADVGTGSLTINGRGGTTVQGTNTEGIRISGATALVDNNGALTVRGVGGSGEGAGNHGIHLINSGDLVTLGTGEARIEGTVAGTGDLSHGVLLASGSGISSTGGAADGQTVRIIGTGGTGGGSVGVRVQDASSTLLVLNRPGEIVGSGVGTLASHGVEFADGALLQGLLLTLSGASSNASGIAFNGAPSTIDSGSGDLVLRADTMNFTNATFTGTGTASIQNRSAGTTIAIGNGATGTLDISNSELNRLAASNFSNITFGSSTAGLITTDAVDFTGFNTPNIRLLGTSLATGGINAGPGKVLTLRMSGGTVTQTGAILSESLKLFGTSAYTLTNAGNNVDALAGDVTSGVYADSTDLNIGVITGTTGLLSRGDFEVRTPGTLTNNAAISALAGTLTLSANEVNLDALVSGPGSLVLQPLSSTANVRVNDNADSDPATLDITQSDLSFIAPNLALVTFGRNDSSGTMSFGTATPTFAPATSTRLRMGPAGGSGIINVTREIVLTGDDSLTIRAANVNLGANLTTGTGDILVAGNTRLAENVSILSNASGTGGGDITFNGPVDADVASNNRVLTLDAGSTGDVTFNGVVGAADRLQTLNVASAQRTIINGGVRTQGGQSYTTIVDLAGDISSNAGDVSFQRQLNVTADSNITSSGLAGDDVTFVEGIASTVSGADLTVSSGSGQIVLQTTNTLGRQTYNGETLLNANVTGAELVFGGPVTLAQNVVATGTSSVVFQNTINSSATDFRTLAINSPATTLLGSVGAGSGGTLGALTTDSGTLALSAQTIRTRDNVDIGDVITLGADAVLESTSAQVILRNSVNSDSTARAFTANSATGVRLLGGAGGGGGALQSLVTSAPGGNTVIGGTIETTTALTFTTPVLVATNAIVRAPGVTFGGTTNASPNATAGLTVVSTGQPVTFTSDVGNTRALQSLDVTASQINLGNVRTVGNQLYTGPARLAGLIEGGSDATIDFTQAVLLAGATTIRTSATTSAADIIFRGTVNSITAPQDLTLDAGSGDIVFQSDVGSTTTSGEAQVGNLSATGASVTMRGVRTSGRQLYSGSSFLNGSLISTGTGDISLAGATQLLSDATVGTTSGSVIFSGNVDSDSTARMLTVNTGGNGVTRFAGPVGASSRLRSITTNEDGSTVIATSQMRTTGDQLYNDNVTLGANLTIEGNDVLFGRTLDSDAANTPRNLTINTAPDANDSGETTFRGIVGGVRRLGSLSTNQDGSTIIANNVSTTRAINFSDAVLLAGSSVIDAGNGAITFRQTLNADTSATDPLLTLLSNAPGNVDAPSFRFGGNIGSGRRLGGLTLGTDRAQAQAGSIVFSDAYDPQGRVLATGVSGSDSFSVQTAAGGFNVAAGHKITAFGNLNITSTGAVTLNDVTALGNLGVTGAAINLRSRGFGEVQDRNRQLVRDSGADIVSGGGIDFSRTPTVLGSGNAPAFSPGNGVVDAQLSAFTFRVPARPIAASDFVDASNSQVLLPLDLRASGPSRTTITTSIVQPPPQLSAPRNPLAPLAQPGAFAGLAELGISTRGRTIAEVVEGLEGRNFDDRLPTTGLAESGVRQDMLSEQSVQRAVDAYRGLVYGPLTDERGNVLEDEQGQVRVGDRTATIRSVLAASWARYGGKVNKPTGEGWRAYLESQGTTGPLDEQQALAFLNQARETLRAIDNLGLPTAEIRVPRRKVIDAIKPEQIVNEREFVRAVEGVWQFSSR